MSETQEIPQSLAEETEAPVAGSNGLRPWGKLLSLTPRHCDNIELVGESVSIGRAHQASLESVRQVSAQHCRAFLLGERVVMVEDLSTNGTFIDKTRVGKSSRLVLPPNGCLHLTNPQRSDVPQIYF